MPSGAFEITLALIFCLVILSGFFGLYISRELPPRMARSGEALLYERIPAFRAPHPARGGGFGSHQAERETDSSTLGDFYVQYLRDFFTARARALFFALGRPTASGTGSRGTNALDRYLNDREKAIAREIRDWIETKQNLDFQYASQRLLKLWLFVHIPFTYSLMVCSASCTASSRLFTQGGCEMQRPLDPLSFKKNTYDRPNQDWVCGHAAEGRACPLGPDERGNCRHTGECIAGEERRPLVLHADRRRAAENARKARCRTDRARIRFHPASPCVRSAGCAVFMSGFFSA